MAASQISVEAALSFLAQQGYNMPDGPFRAETLPTKSADGQHSLCEGFTGSYSLGLHIGSLFLILCVSFLGTAIPILGKCIPWLVRYPFVFSVAKSAATGVLLSVSTIHLIFEGADAFEEPCVPQLLKNYAPLYFLLALIAVLLMQALDMQLAATAESWMKAKARAEAETAAADGDKADGAGGLKCRELTAEVEVGLSSSAAPAEGGANSGSEERPLRTFSDAEFGDSNADGKRKPGSRSTAPMASMEDCDAAVSTLPDQFDHCHHHADEPLEHGHQHLSVAPPADMGAIRRVIAAVCMEFGVTLHSVFVGLTVGLTTDSELKPLIVALVFHQLFEGMAMGSRLADAEFKGSLDIILALVFSVSAPVGMAAAAIAVSVAPAAMSGSAFVSVIAILDTFCGGILLYLAFTLLLGDFVADVKRYGADDQWQPMLKKTILFVAVWLGMGLMALVGNWL